MLSLTIKCTINYFSLIYAYCKLQKEDQSPTPNSINFLGISIIISVISYAISQFCIHLSLICSFIICYIYLKLQFKEKGILTLLKSIVSYALCLVSYTLSVLLVSITFLFIYSNPDDIPYEYTDISTSIIQIILIYIVFKFKRLRNGLLLLLKTNKIRVGVFLSFLYVLYVAFVFSTPNTLPYFVQLIVFPLSSSLALLLPFYFERRITQTYREKLRLVNEKSLEDELNKQKETIANLEADNARLSQIVHKDNKIILAMLTAVTEHLENATNATPDEQIIRGKELRAQLQNMADERQGILNTQSNLPNALPKSGLHTVDGMLSFMETRAKEAGITYKLQLAEKIKELAGKSIDEADLLHMLGDLIENSLIATKHTNNEKEILIHLGSLQGHFLLEISDSGIPFSLETYQRFGNEQHTTHSEDGGSGIGLMDIWKLKKKYKASLHIYEYEEVEGIYTKKLAFIFDRKNHFLLQTPRYKEATYALTRGDLYIFSNKEE